ncbi:TauD/TfdA family dioxygenase [Siccirubricoccus deserti]
MVRAAEAEPAALPQALAECGGLLLLPGMEEMAEAPELLLRLSRLFGPEVEIPRDRHGAEHGACHGAGDFPRLQHPAGPAPAAADARPAADRGWPAAGAIPHRRGWHTDQSYRRPPPDVSLFLAVIPVPQGQGQTLFADASAAYAALSPTMKARIEGLEGLHISSGAGRKRDAVLAGDAAGSGAA